MLKRILAILAATVLTVASAFAQMSDESLINLVSQGIGAGKSTEQIGSELMAKGATVEQARRVIQKQGIDSGSVNVPASLQNQAAVSSGNRARSAVRVADSNKAVVAGDNASAGSTSVRIYGHDIFGNGKLSFEPNVNSATPLDYVLGPEDEVIIDVWGVNEATIRQTISPEGRIIVSQVGPITLSGLTIQQAEKKLKEALSSKYSLKGSDSASQISLTLGKIRTIQVHLMGEVKAPGTYRLSSLSTVFNALYHAGGVTEIGTVRNIQVSRNGEIISTVDLYSMLFDGGKAGNVSLRDGDIIMIPPYYALAETGGGFKRPMLYEIMPGDKVSDVIKFTGGFVSANYDREVMLQHREGASGDVVAVPSADFDKVEVKDGDKIIAYENVQRTLYSNMVQVRGCVARPGIYEIGGEIATLRQLVERAGGPLEEAFLNRAQLLREKADRQLEVKAVALGAIIAGDADDITLRANDILVVSSKFEIEPKGDFTINGYVRRPGTYDYAEGVTVQDLILQAGGLEDGASLVKIDVSRRLSDPTGTTSSDTLAIIFSYSMENGLMVEGEPDFILEPYDIVSVRKSPSYTAQKQVFVSGEVNFPGEYTLSNSEERISSLLSRAGGATANAYVGGAVLKRRMTEDERNVQRNMKTLLDRGGNVRDSLLLQKLNTSEIYSIGINLDKALDSPGSNFDLILRDGDELIVPSRTNTVRVQGEVMYPNAVNFVPGENVGYYIKQAGGYSNVAKRSKVYVVHMNGKVSVGRGAKICAGDEVVVPIRPERRETTLGEWIGLGSTAASITTMFVTILSLVK